MAKPVDISAILSGLENALRIVRDVAPVAGKFEVVANVATIAIAAAEIGRNILLRVEEGKIVLASNDEAKIKAILADLQETNDALDRTIRDS